MLMTSHKFHDHNHRNDYDRSDRAGQDPRKAELAAEVTRAWFQPHIEKIWASAEKQLDRMAIRADSLDGNSEKVAYEKAIRLSGSTPNSVFSDAEAARLLPMIDRSSDALAQTMRNASSEQHVRRNGSLFAHQDFERELATPARHGRTIVLRSNVDKVVALVSGNEGGPTSINWNDNGAGISVGFFQANQKAGKLPELLQRMHEANPERFNQIFGRQANQMLNENFVRRAHFSPRNELGRHMQAALLEPDFQRVQVVMLREHVMRANEIARSLGIKSTLGVALIADLTNQYGEAGALGFLSQARRRRGEVNKIQAIANASNGESFRAGRYSRIVSSGLVSSRDNFDV